MIYASVYRSRGGCVPKKAGAFFAISEKYSILITFKRISLSGNSCFAALWPLLTYCNIISQHYVG